MEGPVSMMARFHRPTRLILSLALAGIFLLALAAPTAAAPTVHVMAGQSIQAAIDAAAPGTTIIVAPGVYHENLQITTDGISLRGAGPDSTFLVPPDVAQPTLCSEIIEEEHESLDSGICIIGVIDPESGAVPDPVRDVRVSGFNIHGFSGPGILMLGAADPFIHNNVAWDNEEYGIAAFISTGDHFVANTTYANGVAGIYVGDSPNADAHVVGNTSYGNLGFGIFARNAAHGAIIGNTLYDNCVGLLVLNVGEFLPVEQAGASDWTVRDNQLNHNNAVCPPDEEGPPLSGIGLAIVGGHAISVKGNTALNNVPNGPTVGSGGVVVVSAAPFGSTDPSDVTVMGNVVLGNTPDLFWDGTGSGIVFTANDCATSVPAGLCG